MIVKCDGTMNSIDKDLDDSWQAESILVYPTPFSLNICAYGPEQTASWTQNYNRFQDLS